MSKEMDDFRARLQTAATHAKVPFTPQSLGTFLRVDRRKAAVWMSGSLPRPEKIFEHADKFGVDPRWYATGKGDMVPSTRGATAEEPTQVYDASVKPIRTMDAESLLVVVRTFLDTDDEGRKELLKAAKSIADEHRGTARQAQHPRRANKRR